MTCLLALLLFSMAMRPFEGQRPLAVQGALDSELQPLLEAIGRPPVKPIGPWSFWEGTIGSRPVVVSRTEVGLVNAAVATTLLIQHYSPEVIVNQGTAGAANPELKINDIVVGRASVPYGAFRSERRLKGQGVDLQSWQPLPMRLRQGEERVAFNRFLSDPDLVELARQTTYDRGRVVVGVVGSADQYNREIDKLLWARELYGIDSEDMESAAVAQVAQALGVKFLPVRIISDSEFLGGDLYPETGALCARFVVDLLRRLAGPKR